MLRVSHHHHLPLRRFICKPNVQRSHDFAVVFGNGNKMPQNVTYALCSVDVGQTIEGPGGCVALILDKHSLKDSNDDITKSNITFSGMRVLPIGPHLKE